ncbi:MAG TPA: DUF411 domain-containing protein [Luteitalea sp.]|nr:DUF411 domain-containing protein [Luteitalea sp.]
MTRVQVKRWGGAAVAALTLTGAVVMAQGKAATPTVLVHKTPTCGCCGKWVSHLEAAGFKVEVQNHDEMTASRAQHKLPEATRSCHFALVGPYVVEGHVPAADVKKLLASKPAIKGIAVPGMPAGSPGMESPNPQKYDTLAFTADGKTSVFASH